MIDKSRIDMLVKYLLSEAVESTKGLCKLVPEQCISEEKVAHTIMIRFYENILIAIKTMIDLIENNISNIHADIEKEAKKIVEITSKH